MKLKFVWCLLSQFCFVVHSFVVETRRSAGVSTKLNAEWKRKIEQARDNASGGGLGETAAGVVLGGVMLGPLGALFGAQIGASMGAKRAQNKAMEDEMNRLGVSAADMEMAGEVGASLNRALEGLQVTRESLETQQRFAKRLEGDMERVYEQAKEEMVAGNEEKARGLLEERQRITTKLKKVLLDAAEERKRVLKMESNVEILEQRVMEVETMLKRTIGAKALQDTSFGMIPPEDPLLEKFKNL